MNPDEIKDKIGNVLRTIGSIDADEFDAYEDSIYSDLLSVFEAMYGDYYPSDYERVKRK